MRIKDVLASKKTAFSFEFFPPKTEAGFASLFANLRERESHGEVGTDSNLAVKSDSSA